MPRSTLSRRLALGLLLGATLGLPVALAQDDDLSGIPNVERLTEQERQTYRRRLRDAKGDQERAQIREEARVHAQRRAAPRQGGGQGAGSSRAKRRPAGSGGGGRN